MEKVIVFQLNDKEYAVPVQQVLSIEKLQHITRVPHTPPYVSGVINLRGVIIPVIDLKRRFAMESAQENAQESAEKRSCKFIIVNIADIEVGLLVDEATDVLDLDDGAIEPEPEVVNSSKEEYISGVANLNQRLLMLLNLDKVLTPLH
ncbi:chemotaxis protein CheW [Heyndrickxia acidiproducens]|uniref:chemotaxis protein CheW n=1 Tax=Heyndrickxia acidiproducens TaxID=1121084 RepID=UPI00037805F7|nr:chemotaxis protein CheW [Heyndrickxia acidiproducens]